MDVPIQHIIGTVALIGLVISAGFAYTIITSYIEGSVIEQQLKQVSEIVALGIVEMVNLSNFTNFGRNNTMMRTIDLPIDVGGKAYAVQLMKETDQTEGYNVTSYLLTDHNVKASSFVPFNFNSTSSELYWVKEGKIAVISELTIYGGSDKTVVWAWSGGDITTAGLGRISQVG